MLKRTTAIIIAIAIFISFIPVKTQALSCAFMTPEEHLANSDVILQAEVLNVVFEDGTPHRVTNEYNNRTVYLQVHVSQVWLGEANEYDVIEYKLAEWGQPQLTGASRIFYLNRTNGIMATSPCARTTSATAEEQGFLDANVNVSGKLLAAQSTLYAEQIASNSDSDKALLPIAIGPDIEMGSRQFSTGLLIFNLVCFMMLVAGMVGAYLVGKRRNASKLANSDQAN